MTEKQATQICQLRDAGYGYGRIAHQLGLPEGTVRSFCHRKGIKRTPVDKTRSKHLCLNCGKPVAQNPGRKEKKFCSDKCRMNWWNSHPDCVNHHISRELVCPNCHKTFIVFGSAPRKYCCHECYVEDRYESGDQ